MNYLRIWDNVNTKPRRSCGQLVDVGGDNERYALEVVPIPMKRKEVLTETDIDTGSITFTNTMEGVTIVNQSSTNSLTYTINTIPVTLEPGETDTGYYEPFTEVEITGTTPNFKAIGLGR